MPSTLLLEAALPTARAEYKETASQEAVLPSPVSSRTRKVWDSIERVRRYL